MSKTISQLPNATTIQDSDKMVIDQADATRNISISQLNNMYVGMDKLSEINSQLQEIKNRLANLEAGEPIIPVTGVSLNKSSHTFSTLTTTQLSATVVPSNATNKDITWSTSNSSVAIVSATGLVTAKASGNATITVRTTEGNKTATCTITVDITPQNKPVTSVGLEPTRHTFTELNDTVQLTPSIFPWDATNKNVTWSSNNTNVATVSNGLVTAKGDGTTVVTVTTQDGNKTATCDITVNTETPPIEEKDVVILMSNNILKLDIDKNANVIPIVYPLNSDSRFSWSSTNTNIATVDQEGLITTKAFGNCKIIATHIATNQKVECTVQVEQSITGDVEKNPITLDGWVQGGLDWSGHNDASKDTSVRSNYIQCGQYPIEFTTPRGLVWTKVHFYNVNKEPITNENQGLLAGGTVTTGTSNTIITPPRDTKYMRLQVTSSAYNLTESTNVAKLIVATELLVEGSIYDRYDSFNNNGVIVNTRKVLLNPSKQFSLVSKEVPLGSTNGISFRSDNDSVATVSSSGVITAKATGKCNIIAHSNNGVLPTTIEVVVYAPINTGTSFDSLTGASSTDKLKRAFVTGGEINGNNQTHNVSGFDCSVASNLTIRNITLNGSSNKNNITVTSSGKTLTFVDCTFSNVGFWYSNFSSNVKFERCTFKDWKYCPNTFMTNNINAEFVDCVFKDNKPDTDEWTANTNWERFWAYNPINIYGNNVTLKVNGCTFNNIMSRCVIYAKDKYTGSRIEIDNNTFYRTEGHCINMESSCTGFVDNNHFYLVGDLRGEICHETQQQTGVGGNCVFAHGEYAPYSDVSVKHNTIRYAIENGVEGGLKEVAYNYIEHMGYRHNEGIENPSMEGIWGSARNGIHHNTIINPNMDGIRIQSHGLANNVPCNIYNNIMIYNDLVDPKDLGHVGISAVSTENSDSGVNTTKNTIIGFSKITKVDEAVPNVDFSMQSKSEYAYPNATLVTHTEGKAILDTVVY